jgi:hypothetical protein
MQTGPSALDTVEIESGSAHNENGTGRPRYHPKMSPGAQNMKKGPDTLISAEIKSGSTNHENETQRPHFRRNRIR